MKALVVGYGSIGKRHARILSEITDRVAVVSRRMIDHCYRYEHLINAVEIENPDYVVIANETVAHYNTLRELAEIGYGGNVLCEKPLFDRNRMIPANNFKKIFVAYNLRFHPILKKLKEILTSESIISVQAYAGQYLPSWRTGTDFRKCYSSIKSQGGGVLRDLSHELDYLNWLVGDWVGLTAIGGKYSRLDIDSDDMYTIMLTTKKCPAVILQINYLDRTARRQIIVNTDRHTLEADLIAGILKIDGSEEIFSLDPDLTYRAMHQAVLGNFTIDICTLNEGMEVMRMIETAEKSASQRGWYLRQ